MIRHMDWPRRLHISARADKPSHAAVWLAHAAGSQSSKYSRFEVRLTYSHTAGRVPGSTDSAAGWGRQRSRATQERQSPVISAAMQNLHGIRGSTRSGPPMDLLTWRPFSTC